MAGLLDSLFNPSLYGGQNGGLLDFLRNTQMQQNTYQPSEGFAPPPTPSQAQPIMVGNALMPPEISSRNAAVEAIMARAESLTADGAMPSAQLTVESAVALLAAVSDQL